jgi:hypothetical protein
LLKETKSRHTPVLGLPGSPALGWLSLPNTHSSLFHVYPCLNTSFFSAE